MFNLKIKAFAALFLSFAVCTGVHAGISASANSAMLEWEGSYAAGSTVLDENCPVTVKSELLTFNINEFPEQYYSDNDEDRFLNYGGRVTARYDFYNPADYDMEMSLAFPFGYKPRYVDFYEDCDDTVKYSVTANGEKVPTKLRHTFALWDFETDVDVGRLHDGFKEDGFYTENLPVYVYRFRISGIALGSDYYVQTELDINEREGRIILSTADGYMYNNGCTVSWAVRNGDEIELYSVGKPMSEDEFGFRFFYYGKFYNKKYVDGKAERGEDEEMTFKQLALTYREEGSVVSETDWCNAVTDALLLKEDRGGYADYYSLNVGASLMRWYEYSLSIPAGGSLINEVTAPLYPHINGYYEPSIYSYEYLLSPAKGWVEFGSLEVKINTPYFMTENPFGFERTDYGYHYFSDGLPDGELKFTLCEVENPKRANTGLGMAIFIIIPLALLIGVIAQVVAGLVILVVFIVKKSKSKRQ